MAELHVHEGRNGCGICGGTVMRLSPRASGGWDMHCDKCGAFQVPIEDVLMSSVRPRT